MSIKRGSSKLKEKQLQTKFLQEQTKRMEDKLQELKKQIQEQKRLKQQMKQQTTVQKWRNAVKSNAPLKSYGKQILEQKKKVHQQFGIDQKQITGTKTFSKVLKKLQDQKQEKQFQNPTKISILKSQILLSSEKDTLPQVQSIFSKAKMTMTDLKKQKTLQQFLQQNYILQYLASFKDAGLTDLQSLRYIDKAALQQLGVKAGHQVKIIKKVKDYFDSLLSKPVTLSLKEVQSKGKEEQSKPVEIKEKVQFGYGDGDVNQYKQQDINTDQPQNVYQEKQQDQQEEDDAVELMDTVFISQIAQQSEQINANCYECYRLVVGYMYTLQQKSFCSQKCLEKYRFSIEVTCTSCSKLFFKTDGFREQGCWFCSVGCCPNRQEIQQLFFSWHNKRG